MTTQTELIYLSKKLIFLETPQKNPLIKGKTLSNIQPEFTFYYKSKQHIHKSPRQNMMVLYTKAGSL